MDLAPLLGGRGDERAIRLSEVDCRVSGICRLWRDVLWGGVAGAAFPMPVVVQRANALGCRAGCVHTRPFTVSSLPRVSRAADIILLVPILATWYIVARVYRDMDPDFFAKINSRVAEGGAPLAWEARAFGMTLFAGVKYTPEVLRGWWLARFPPRKEKEDAQQAAATETSKREE